MSSASSMTVSLVNPIDHDGSIENQIMRSDLEFTKKGEDGQDRLAGVAFKLTSEATGESHVVVTDENGYFSSASSWNKHTHDTNGNDWALKADGVIDSSKLDAAAGVWFGDARQMTPRAHCPTAPTPSRSFAAPPTRATSSSRPRLS